MFPAVRWMNSSPGFGLGQAIWVDARVGTRDEQRQRVLATGKCLEQLLVLTEGLALKTCGFPSTSFCIVLSLFCSHLTGGYLQSVAGSMVLNCTVFVHRFQPPSFRFERRSRRRFVLFEMGCPVQ